MEVERDGDGDGGRGERGVGPGGRERGIIKVQRGLGERSRRLSGGGFTLKIEKSTGRRCSMSCIQSVPVSPPFHRRLVSLSVLHADAIYLIVSV